MSVSLLNKHQSLKNKTCIDDDDDIMYTDFQTLCKNVY